MVFFFNSQTVFEIVRMKFSPEVTLKQLLFLQSQYSRNLETILRVVKHSKNNPTQSIFVLSSKKLGNKFRTVVMKTINPCSSF